MAIIHPFQAWRYDTTKVRLEDVVTQPYDKISLAMQDRYYSASPCNLVRIILGKPEPGDDDHKNVYSRAAADFMGWREQGVLRYDPTPSIYAYQQQFKIPGDPSGVRHIRTGFIALGKLHDYSEQVVHRHEQTLSKPKADRLNLLRATRGHFGQIFMLYRSSRDLVGSLVPPPTMSMKDEYGVEHRVWRTIASGGYVTTESVPASAAPATALSSTSANVTPTNVATYSIAPGQIVVREAFGKQPAAVGPLSIPGTLQAITISVPANADVAGYVQQGSEVAVYSINQITKSAINNQLGGTPYISKLLLPRVKVIAVSAAAPSSTNGTGSVSAGTVLVTLALTQQQAERTVLAQKIGDLYLALLTDASVSNDGDGGILGAGIVVPNLLFPR